MGSFSIWHWLIILVLIGLPLLFVLRAPPAGSNRFGDIPPPMNFTEAISSFFKNYATFSGRASRSEFWFSYLFLVIVGIVASIIDIVVNNEIVSSIWNLAVLVPTLAMSSRRLHDINRSGWLQLLVALFPIGTIAVIVWYCKKSDETVTMSEIERVFK
jgi:Predicted membrane protein